MTRSYDELVRLRRAFSTSFAAQLAHELEHMRVPAVPPQPPVTPALEVDAAVEVAVEALLGWADDHGRREDVIRRLGWAAEQLGKVWLTPNREGKA